MRIASILFAAALIGVPVAAAAQDTSRYGHDAIERGDFSEAESALRAQLALEPSKPELLINLAAIYARTNRLDDAQALYQRVLASEDMSLLLRPGHALGSHAIAQRGMRKLEQQRMAAR